MDLLKVNRSKRTPEAPLPSTALKLSSGRFVFSDLHGSPVQPEEPPALRDHLLPKLYGRLLLAANPQQNPQ
jgi:hypothetical protein